MSDGNEYSANMCACKSEKSKNIHPSAWRETKRVVVFYSSNLEAAVDKVVTYAKSHIDHEFAINGMPRNILPWRMPGVKISPATAVLAAQYLAKEREATGAQMLSDAMMMVGTDCVIEGLCVAEDLALVCDNFTERFGDDA